MRNKGSENRSTATANGRVEIQRRRWHLQGVGSCSPLDALMDAAEATVSLGLRELCCRQNAEARSFDKAAETLAKVGQVRVSGELLRQVVEAEGRRALALAAAEELRPGWTSEHCRTTAPDGREVRRIYVGADAYMVSLVTDVEKENRLRKVREKRPKRGKKARALGRRKKGADQRWKEVKAVTFYSEDMKHRHTSVTRGNCDALGRLMRRDAENMEFHRAQERVSNVDGGPWIIRQFEKRLNTNAVGLDFYHLGQNVHKTKNTTVIFTQAGVYTFQATMAEDNWTATSDVTVTVEQTLTSLSLSPSGNLTVLAGGTQQFAATGYDQFGTVMAAQPAFTWSVSDPTMGTINAAGLLAAGTSYGPLAVTASSGGITASETVTISPLTSGHSLAAMPLDSGDIGLYWLNLPALANGETLEYSTDSTFNTGVTSVNLAAGVSNYTASGLSAATSYYFELLPTGSSGPAVGTASATTFGGNVGGSGGYSAPVITQQASYSQPDPNDVTLTMAATGQNGDPISYLWQLISAPSNAQAPGFDPGYQTVTAQVFAAGNYVFMGTATDTANGLSTTAMRPVRAGLPTGRFNGIFRAPCWSIRRVNPSSIIRYRLPRVIGIPILSMMRVFITIRGGW